MNAYGWSGPWAGRRGFDSLVQMSAGLAEAGMRWRATDRPTPLPVQALDYATGYLMAAAAVQAIRARFRGDGSSISRLSLVRTAKMLTEVPLSPAAPFDPEDAGDIAPAHEATSWGKALRLLPPMSISETKARWDHPASPLGSAAAAWRS